MNCGDIILHYVDKYIAEREKNIYLRQKLEQLEEKQDEKLNMQGKDNKANM